MKPYIVIEDSSIERFEEEIKEKGELGYKLHSGLVVTFARVMNMSRLIYTQAMVHRDSALGQE